MSYLEELMVNVFQLTHLRDFVIVAGKDEQKFPVHRNVIEASCSNFHKLVEYEPDRKRIVLPEINGAMLQATITYIYSGHIQLTFDNVMHIVYSASMLGIELLKDKCVQFLIDNLSLENCIYTLTSAVNCDLFELFRKTWKYVCENSGQITFSKMRFPHTSRSNDCCFDDAGIPHITKCFAVMASKHTDHIPNLLKSIRLENVPSKFLSDVLAPQLSEYGLTDILLTEYRRRTLEPSAKNSIAITSSWTPEQIHCAHYSSDQGSLIVRKFNMKLNAWEEVRSIACVSACIRYVYNGGKLFIVADQGDVRIVESYDLKAFRRSVFSQVLPWRAGFRTIAIDDYIYVLAGVGWHADLSESLGLLGRLYIKNWGQSHLWETLEPMPVQKFRYSTAEMDGRIYVAGGERDRVFCDQFLCYDTKSNTWTEKASIRMQSTNATLFKSSAILYAIGIEGHLHKYDPDADTWTEIGPFRGGETIIDTAEYHNETYAICKGGRFGIIQIGQSGGYLSPMNDEMPIDFEPFHPPILFVN